jgi:uncharacterized protein YgiM (DUF1202 family)
MMSKIIKVFAVLIVVGVLVVPIWLVEADALTLGSGGVTSTPTPSPIPTERQSFPTHIPSPTTSILLTPTPSVVSGVVVADHLNVRNGPSVGFVVIGVVDRGQVVQVAFCQGEWAYVENLGWVHSGWLTVGCD